MNEEQEHTLVRTVASPQLTDMSSEGIEKILDAALEEGVVRDIPVVGWAVKLYRAANDIRGNLFVKKILRFLRPISELDHGERLQFSIRMDEDVDLRQRVEENLLLLLDRLDDMGKPELIGRLFSAYLRQELAYEDFQRLAGSIDRAYMPDLSLLGDLGEGQQPPLQTRQALLMTGLAEIDAVPQVRGEGAENTVRITELGRLLLKYLYVGRDAGA